MSDRPNPVSVPTPGPWRAVLSDEQQPQLFYHGLVCVLERSHEQWTSVVAVSGYAGADRDTIDANARLIAAAPSLYAALRIAQELLARNGITRPEIEAALRKATGSEL